MREDQKLKKVAPKSHNVTKAKTTLQNQPLIKSFLHSTPILDLCGRMAVEDARPFSTFESRSMQEMVTFGKEGAKDRSKKAINSENVRGKVQEDAEKLRKEFTEKLKTKVIHLSADMASKDGRCFFGMRKFMISFEKISKHSVYVLGLNTQFFDHSSKTLCLYNLVSREVETKHSGNNIRGWVLEAMKLFEIEDDQVLGVSIDSAKNITKAIDDMIKKMMKKNYKLMIDFLRDDDEDDDAENVENGQDDTESEEDEFQECADALSDFSIYPVPAIRVHCVAHRFQLGVCGFLYKDEEVAELVSLASTAVRKLRTTVVRRLAKSEVGPSKLKQPKLSQATRWSSVYYMLERLLEYEMFCKKYANAKDMKDLRMSEDKWDSFRDLVKILKPAQVLTTKLQAQELTVTDTVYFWCEMKESLNEIALDNDTSEDCDRLVAKLIDRIEERETDVLNNVLTLAGWYLGQSMQFTMNDEQTSEAKEVIRMVALKRYDLANPTAADVPQESDDDVMQVETEPEEVLQQLTPFQMTIKRAVEQRRLLTQKEQQAENSQSSQAQRSKLLVTLNKEFDAYENDSITGTSDEKPDSLKFWMNSEDQYPILAPTALDIVTAPMTEVSVERLFSHMNFVLNPRRNCLKGDILEDILFLRMNRKFAD